MKEYAVRTLIVGSGCAGYNAADCLLALGQQDVMLATESRLSGTSRNTGSDKQTYYRLSLAGDEGDSVGMLTKTLSHQDSDGDTALCEAAASTECFFKLARLGVPFPSNEYGEYVGYRTDHDERLRASSAGPLTSRFMTEALEKSALDRGLCVMDHLLIYRIIADETGVIGAEGYDTQARDWVRIRCAHVILATGGPANLYRSRVYPESQHGMSGMAFLAGAEGQNLHRWQYGLASVGFRWNVSGSYQQVLPRYLSVDKDGREHDFLSERLTVQDKLTYCFRKGYEWPFDPNKARESSLIDLLVKAQGDANRRVYLDFTRNPTGYEAAALQSEAADYLHTRGATQETPYARLLAMNAPAAELYRAHGIDLAKDRLEIKVCAQHHNGGLAVDASWQTRVPGLYACGEAAGTFGRVRPGGSALNSTQVGSQRAALDIARVSTRKVARTLPPFAPPLVPRGDPAALEEELASAMTGCAAITRDVNGMNTLQKRLGSLREDMVIADPRDAALAHKLTLADMMVTQERVLLAMLHYETEPDERVLMSDAQGNRYRDARPAPRRELVFERVWREGKGTWKKP